jgi:hypothetical protein
VTKGRLPNPLRRAIINDERQKEEARKMAKAKQYVFSARTTEEGLKLLSKLKAEKGIGWDELVIDAVCDRYGLDTLVMSLPKAYRPEKKKAEAKVKKGGGGAKARKTKATKEKTPAVDEVAEETQAQQE